MAGVQPAPRRPTIPWPLIVFVLLFVIAFVAWLLMFIKRTQLLEDRNAAQEKLNKVAARGDLLEFDPQIKEAQQAGLRLIQYLDKKRGELAELIDTDPGVSNQELQHRIHARYEEYNNTKLLSPTRMLNKNLSLMEAAKNLFQTVSELSEDKRALQGEKDALVQQVDELTRARDASRDRFEKQVAQLKQQNQQIRQDLEDYKGQRDKDLDDLKKTLDQLNQHVAKIQRDADNEKEKLGIQIEKFQNTIRRLRNALESLRQREPTELASVADGKVHRVLPQARVVYIDLGRQDQLALGMRFVVFSPEVGLTKEGKGKAVIEVIEIHSTFSECRIVEQSPGQAVRKDDLIANPVYDRARKYRFAVVGQFDLDFDGHIDKDARTTITALIERWGGMVADQVTEDTDFLVLGVPPVRPKKPTPDMQPEQLRNIEKQKALVDEYDQARSDAKDLAVEILGRLRFLNLMGHGKNLELVRAGR